MDAVLQKIKADLVSRPVISILTVITVTLASTLLTLALATLANTNAPYDKAFEEINGAHLWLYFDRSKIRLRDIEKIETMPGVTQSTGLQYSIMSRVQIHDVRVWTSLRVISLEQPAVNRLLVQAGRYLTLHQTETLASKDLNNLQHLLVGDAIGVTRWDGKKVNLPVIGLAYNPMWDIYRTDQPPYLYISEETMRELFPDKSTWDWSIGLRLADPQSVDEILAQIKTMLRPDAIKSHTDWRAVRDTATFDARISFVFLGAFSLFAILATVLVISSSISSIVLSQFKQIGILKAIGFTRPQILWLYLGQCLALTMIGAPLGVLLGFALAPLPLKTIAVSLSTPYHPPFDVSLAALVFITIMGVVSLAALGAAYRGAQANIIRSIAVGVEAPRKELSWGIRLLEQSSLPIVMLLGLNDIFAKPFRSFLTGINLTLGVIGIVFGLALNETMDAYKADPSLLGIVYDATVTRETTSDNTVRHMLSGAPGVETFYSEYLANVKTLTGQSFRVRAVEGDLAAFPFKISEGRFFQPNSYEAIAGRGLLNWLGLKVGDQITVTFEGMTDKPITWQIVGQYLEPTNRGQLLMVSLPAVAQHVKNIKATTYFLKLARNYSAAQLKQYLAPKPEADLNLTIVGDKLPSYIVYLRLAIFILSAILIGVALINVFDSSWLSMQERLRIVGILKAVGMTPIQVVMMVNTTAGFLGFIAAAFGIPLGLAFTKNLLATLANTYGFSEMRVSLSVFYALLLPPLMAGISMLGSTIPGQQAATLSIVNVLWKE